MLNRIFTTPGTIGAELFDVYADSFAQPAAGAQAQPAARVQAEPAAGGQGEAIYRRVLQYHLDHETDSSRPAYELLFFRLTAMS